MYCPIHVRYFVNKNNKKVYIFANLFAATKTSWSVQSASSAALRADAAAALTAEAAFPKADAAAVTSFEAATTLALKYYLLTFEICKLYIGNSRHIH